MTCSTWLGRACVWHTHSRLLVFDFDFDCAVWMCGCAVLSWCWTPAHNVGVKDCGVCGTSNQYCKYQWVRTFGCQRDGSSSTARTCCHHDGCAGGVLPAQSVCMSGSSRHQ